MIYFFNFFLIFKSDQLKRYEDDSLNNISSFKQELQQPWFDKKTSQKLTVQNLISLDDNKLSTQVVEKEEKVKIDDWLDELLN